jgi:hypothetical protein
VWRFIARLGAQAGIFGGILACCTFACWWARKGCTTCLKWSVGCWLVAHIHIKVKETNTTYCECGIPPPKCGSVCSSTLHWFNCQGVIRYSFSHKTRLNKPRGKMRTKLIIDICAKPCNLSVSWGKRTSAKSPEVLDYQPTREMLLESISVVSH